MGRWRGKLEAVSVKRKALGKQGRKNAQETQRTERAELLFELFVRSCGYLVNTGPPYSLNVKLRLTLAEGDMRLRA